MLSINGGVEVSESVLVPEGELLTTTDVAALLRISQARVSQMVRQGYLRSVQICPRGRHRFTRAEVERLVRENSRS